METKDAIIGILILSLVVSGYLYFYPAPSPPTGTGGEIHFEPLGMAVQYAAIGIPHTCTTNTDCIVKFGEGSVCSGNVCIASNVGNMWASHWVTNNYDVPVQLHLSGDVTCTSSGYPTISLPTPNKHVTYSVAPGATKSDSDWNTAPYNIHSYAISNLLVDEATSFVCSVDVLGTYVVGAVSYDISPSTIQYSFTARKDASGSITTGGGVGVGAEVTMDMMTALISRSLQGLNDGIITIDEHLWIQATVNAKSSIGQLLTWAEYSELDNFLTSHGL